MLHYILLEADKVCIRSVVSYIDCSRPLTHRQSISDLGVVVHLTVGVRVCKLNELGNGLHGRTEGSSHRSLAHLASLCGHEDHTVGATYAEHSCCGRVLENRDALDFVRIELRERALDSVDKNKRIGAVERSDAADTDGRLVSSRHAGRLYRRNTGKISLKGVRNVSYRRLQEVVASHSSDSTGDGHLVLLSVSDDDRLVDQLAVRLHVYLHTGSDNRNLLSFVTHA